MLHSNVLHVSVHQNHHWTPWFQKSNNICNMQICIKVFCLAVYLVCISVIPVIFVFLLRNFIFKEEANTNDRRKSAKDSLFMKLHTQQWIVIYFSMVFSLCVSMFSTWKKPCHIKLLSCTASFPTTQKIKSLQWKDKSVNYTQESHYYLLRELTETLI